MFVLYVPSSLPYVSRLSQEVGELLRGPPCEIALGFHSSKRVAGKTAVTYAPVLVALK